MNFKERKKTAILLLVAILFINLFPVPAGPGEVIVTPMVQTAEAATTAPTPTLTPSSAYVMYDMSTAHPVGSQIDMDGSTKSLSIATAGTPTTPVGATIEWLSYDPSVISVQYVSDFEVKVTSVNPGYAQLGAIVTHDGVRHYVYCNIHVPLELGQNDSKNAATIGMLDNVMTTDTTKRLILNGPEVTAAPTYNEYLIKLKYSNYMGNTNFPDAARVTSGGSLTTAPASLTWSSSNTDVVSVDEHGIVRAVGSGYAEVTVTTDTKSGSGKADSLTIPVFIIPTATIGTTGPSNNFDYTYNGSTLNIRTNAKLASNLVWTIRKDSGAGDLLKLEDNPYMDVDISKISDSVTLTNLKAGVYYITARQHKDFSEDNGKIKPLHITLIVPVNIKKDHVYMSVGDTYEILENSNLPGTSFYSFSLDPNYSPNVASVNSVSGQIKGLSSGNTKILMDYKDNLFKSPYNLAANAQDETLDVTVIDNISLNMTNATIYTGGQLQLVLNASNSSTVTWTTSDAKVATVDSSGLVTGVAVGDCEIIAKQVVNGVTKTARCKIRVQQSVTNIVLSPTNANVAIKENLTISATITPKLNNVSLKWVSSDPSVVSFVQKGDLSATVTGNKGGTAVIMAINTDNVVVGSCLVKVYEPIKSITLSETKLTVPLSTGWFRLYATIAPTTAEDQEVIWSSSDPSVLTVDSTGKVTLKKAGNAAVIVTSKVDASISAICNVTVTSKATGISISESEKSMYVGETYSITYSLKPATATDSVIWTSTNNSVASVSSTGVVTAKSVGQTVIIAKTSDGAHTAYCTITVSRTATAVKLDVTKLTLNVGDYYTFVTTLTPKDSTETNLTWTSSDTKVAVVSKTGRVTAKSIGTCIIMVKTKSGSTGYCTVTVLQGAKGIEISSKEETIAVGDKLELTATVLPEGASDEGVIWKSNNTKVAKVSKDGIVTGVSGGVAIISSTSNDGNFTDFCIVTVEELITEISLNKTYYKLGLGKTFKLVATIKSNGATNKKLKWTTSNKKIVTVDKNGKIRGLRLGTATITATATDGSGAEATCVVRVTRLVTNISLNTNYITLVEGKSYKLKAKVSPSNATYKVPLWSSKNKSIAIVNKNGTVTALKAGNTIVTAKANDSSGVSSICYVRVIAPVASTQISVSESEVVMSPGETKTVAFSMVPNNSTDTHTWSSDNELVAKVDKKTGKITAKSIGTANITIMAESGRRATIKVYVVGLSRTNITLEQYTSTDIKLEVYGAGTNNLAVRWDVDNQQTATVLNGKVTARSVGTTYVYAVVNGRRLACKVKVVPIQ